MQEFNEEELLFGTEEEEGRSNYHRGGYYSKLFWRKYVTI